LQVGTPRVAHGIHAASWDTRIYLACLAERWGQQYGARQPRSDATCRSTYAAFIKAQRMLRRQALVQARRRAEQAALVARSRSWPCYVCPQRTCVPTSRSSLSFEKILISIYNRKLYIISYIYIIIHLVSYFI